MVFNDRSPGKFHFQPIKALEKQFADLPHEILFFQGWSGILHPHFCLDIKWNSLLLHGTNGC